MITHRQTWTQLSAKINCDIKANYLSLDIADQLQGPYPINNNQHCGD